MTNILGIDPALAKTGAVSLKIYDDKISDAHPMLFESNSKMTQIGRIAHIARMMEMAVNDYCPELIVCEYPFNIKGNGRVLIELYGIIRLHSFRKEIPFVPVPQTTLKKYVTGSGKAEKSDMRVQLYKEYGHEYGEDECDAFWLAHLGYSIRYGASGHREVIAQELKKKYLI